MQSPSGRTWPATQNGLALADAFENAINDFGIAFHDFIGRVSGEDFSSSSMICRTRLPRSMESSKTNLNCGRVFQNDCRGRPGPECACDVRSSTSKPRFLLVGVAQNADEHGGRFQIAGHVHIVDVDQAGFARREIRGG